MIILKTLGIFFLTFIIGNIFGLVFKFVFEPKPEAPKVLNSNTSIEKLKLRGFNNEDFWIKPNNSNVQKVSETKIEPEFKPEILGLMDSPDHFFSKYKIKLVDVARHGNTYRSEEVIAKNGEKWLGFFSGNDGTYLKNTKVKVIQDKDESEIKLASSESQPMFLIKNAKNIKEGKVLTLFQDNYSDEVDFQDRTNVMYPDFIREFQLGERKYTLQIKKALTKSGEKMSALVLETEGVSQVVDYNYYFDGDYLGSLLWVGDLDADGKLDLYMDYNNYEKGSFSSSLFLSSEAAKGKLVKEVANFSTLGC